MKKIITIFITALCAALIFSACEERPQKNTGGYGEKNKVEVTEEQVIGENTEEASKEQTVVEETIDTHVYTGDELSDELIKEKLIGYWEFDDFGYLGGYRFFESGFLQLILDRKVNQTGIFMVKYDGVYFSLDSQNWDEDVLMIQSVSDTEIVGTFGDNVLVLHRADESLIEENSGAFADGSAAFGSGVVDAATEVDQNIRVN